MPECRLLQPASFWVTVPLAFTLGLAYAIVLFGPGFALGTSDCWRLPQGAIGGLEDMKTVMSGYYRFVQDAWRWPLLHFVQPRVPRVPTPPCRTASPSWPWSQKSSDRRPAPWWTSVRSGSC